MLPWNIFIISQQTYFALSVSKDFISSLIWLGLVSFLGCFFSWLEWHNIWNHVILAHSTCSFNWQARFVNFICGHSHGLPWHDYAIKSKNKVGTWNLLTMKINKKNKFVTCQLTLAQLYHSLKAIESSLPPWIWAPLIWAPCILAITSWAGMIYEHEHVNKLWLGKM